MGYFGLYLWIEYSRGTVRIWLVKTTGFWNFTDKCFPNTRLVSSDTSSARNESHTLVALICVCLVIGDSQVFIGDGTDQIVIEKYMAVRAPLFFVHVTGGSELAMLCVS